MCYAAKESTQCYGNTFTSYLEVSPEYFQVIYGPYTVVYDEAETESVDKVILSDQNFTSLLNVCNSGYYKKILIMANFYDVSNARVGHIKKYGITTYLPIPVVNANNQIWVKKSPSTKEFGKGNWTIEYYDGQHKNWGTLNKSPEFFYKKHKQDEYPLDSINTQLKDLNSMFHRDIEAISTLDIWMKLLYVIDSLPQVDFYLWLGENTTLWDFWPEVGLKHKIGDDEVYYDETDNGNLYRKNVYLGFNEVNNVFAREVCAGSFSLGEP